MIVIVRQREGGFGIEMMGFKARVDELAIGELRWWTGETTLVTVVCRRPRETLDNFVFSEDATDIRL